MAIFKSDSQDMRVKLATLKKAVNEKRAAEGLSTITNDHLIMEMVNAAFETASRNSGAGLYISNVFIKV